MANASQRLRRVVFRLELGGLTGWGHLARCAALAHELRRRGRTCVAWTSGDLAVAPEDLREPFSEVRAVAAGPGAADWIVVDHYGVSDADLRDLRAASRGTRLLVIDDEITRTLDAADVVLNTRLGLDTASYACARQLLGERFALLRPGLRRPAAVAASFPAGVDPVFVLLGGTDPRGQAVDAVHALADVDAPGFAPVVVRSRALAGAEALTAALARFPQQIWLERLCAAELAGWAQVCRLAISACGGTLFELALLGLPFVGVVAAENQRAFAREVGTRWMMPIVDAPGRERDGIAAGIEALRARNIMQRGSIGGIDGLGASRVADVIDEISGW